MQWRHGVAHENECGFWKAWGVFVCISTSITSTDHRKCKAALRLANNAFVSDPLPKKIRKVPSGLPSSVSSVSVDVPSLVSEPRLSCHVPSVWPKTHTHTTHTSCRLLSHTTCILWTACSVHIFSLFCYGCVCCVCSHAFMLTCSQNTVPCNLCHGTKRSSTNTHEALEVAVGNGACSTSWSFCLSRAAEFEPIRSSSFQCRANCKTINTIYCITLLRTNLNHFQ